MKKLLSIFIAFMLCISVAGLTAFAVDGSIYAFMGDVNGDFCVDNLDAALILKHDAGLTDLSESQLGYADVNGDEWVDNLDAALILKYDAGLISKFCVEHYFTDASCTAPQTCTQCGLTVGETEGHNVVDGECTVCGYSNDRFEAFSAMVNYLKTYAPQESDNGPFAFSHFVGEGYDFMVGYEFYPDKPNNLIIFIVNETDEGTSEAEICYDVNSDTATIIIEDFIIGDNLKAATGVIDLATFNAKDPQIIDYKPVYETNATENKKTLENDVVICLTDLDKYFTDNHIDCTLAGLGFVNFYAD